MTTPNVPSTHTPGPWQAFTDDRGSVYIWGEGFAPEDNGDGRGYVLGPFEGFRKSDLDLMVAGPVMFEALVAAGKELSRWGWGDMHYGEQPQEKSVVEALSVINDAIAKARGVA